MSKLSIAKFRATIRGIASEAISSGERRLILLAGRESLRYGCSAIRIYRRLAGRDVSLLYSADTDQTGALIGLDYVKDRLEGLVSLDALSLDESDLALGGTWDLLLVDFSKQFRANDLGRLTEAVRGGGLLIFCIPSIDEWLSTLTPFERKLISKPYTESDFKHLFKRRFISKIIDHPGVWLIDLEKGEVHGEEIKVARSASSRFTVNLYGIPLTEDQLKTIEAFQKLIEARGRSCLLVLADRGRGKSAAIGLGLAWYTKKLLDEGRSRLILLTAPEPSNTKTLIEFLVRGLDNLHIGYSVREVGGIIRRVEVGSIEIAYTQPIVAAKSRVAVKIVDEAAGIPIPILLDILRGSRISVFSSTIHGYEGAGRGFSVRFMKALREDPKLNVEYVRLETPIRYPRDDPIERWLYDVLLLDAEPDRIEGEPTLDLVSYRRIDKDDLFRDESMLRSLYSIYVLAHYRNRPNDLAILLDAPHHSARALTYDGKVIVSLWVAEEGGLTFASREDMLREAEASGHVIPSRIALYCGVLDFFKLRGLRIVRIATHPNFTGKGFGSKALSMLESESSGIYHWVGASFGASEELVRFWLKNGYIPLHLSPSINPVSGEYSLVVVKPLTREAYEYIAQANVEFRIRLIESLCDVYSKLELDVARLLLSVGLGGIRVKLTRSQEDRVREYSRGVLSYEASCDSVKALARMHFLSKPDERVRFEYYEEGLMIAKLFMGIDWESIRRILKIDKPLDYMRRITGKMVEWYLDRSE
ncbi:MAG: GNAT family N-acetyltransferase [Candidatus Bathyarchaeota archaeon]|nr:GNAT family N-acetyltransferase [Candidatus Bathyarchaeota archaeon]